MNIKFYGAAREVTGSSYLLSLDDNIKIFVDAGYFQGPEENLLKNDHKINVDWSKVKYLFLTHAHYDHCGRIPIYYKQGFRGKIISTEPTREITKIVWCDSLRINSHKGTPIVSEPLFNSDDVAGAEQLFEVYDYEQKIKLDHGITAMFFDAGHILGSASVQIIYQGQAIAFSGDLGNTPTALLNNTEVPSPAQYVIMESTYGDRLHDDYDHRREILKESILQIQKTGSTLLIPSFAIERSQELLFDLNNLVESKEVAKLPVFLDSPMAIDVTALFNKYRQYLSPEIARHFSSGDDPFNFPNLTLTPSVDESKSINEVSGPKIIIAGSGMMHGGRVVHHLKRVLPNENSIILIVGYQVEGTLGRQIQDGAPAVSIEDEIFEVRSQIKRIESYSAHADQNQLMTWLKSFNPLPGKVFLTHGESTSLEVLSALITRDCRIPVTIPKLGDEITL